MTTTERQQWQEPDSKYAARLPVYIKRNRVGKDNGAELLPSVAAEFLCWIHYNDS